MLIWLVLGVVCVMAYSLSICEVYNMDNEYGVLDDGLVK